MRTKPQDSIFLVTSSDPDNQQFGTAFAFSWEESEVEKAWDESDDVGQYEATYFLTCRHVVKDVGGPTQVMVGDHKAKVVASGSEEGLDDLAVLRVEGLRDLPILRLDASGEPGSPVRIVGFRSFARDFLVRPLQGTLGEQVGLASRHQPQSVKAWDLKIEGDFDLEQGYSGGPVLDEKSGDVIAVANYRLGGRKGVAISVGTLEKILGETFTRIQDSYRVQGTYVVNVFCRELFDPPYHTLEEGGFGATPVDVSVLRSLQVAPDVKFSAIATDNDIRPYPTYPTAVVEADGLGEGDIRTLMERFYSYILSFLDNENTQEQGYMFFVFKNGCPEDMIRSIHKIRDEIKPRTIKSSLNRSVFGWTREGWLSTCIIDFKTGMVDDSRPWFTRRLQKWSHKKWGTPSIESLVKDLKYQFSL